MEKLYQYKLRYVNCKIFRKADLFRDNISLSSFYASTASPCKRAHSNHAFSRQSFRQYDGGQLHRTWGQMHGNNRRQEFDNYERKRIRPTTTGMPRDSGRTVALHKKEERRWGTAFRRKRRELSSSLSSYVKTDDDGNDDNDDDRDGAMFPGGAKFFVKMESARQRGWYESRQKTRQRSHTIDSGIG